MSQALANSRYRRSFSQWILLLLLLSASSMAAASLELSFAVGDVQGEGWSLRGIVVTLSSDDSDQASVDIRVANAVLPDARGTLQDLVLRCDAQRADAEAFNCDKGQLQIGSSPIGSQDVVWNGTLQPGGGWMLSVPGLKLGKGTFALDVAMDSDQQWRAKLTAYRLSLPRIVQLVGKGLLPAGWGVQGRVSGSLASRGRAVKPSRLEADLVIDRISYNAPDDTQVAQGLLAKVEINARRKRAVWWFNNELRLPKGEVYADPVFLDTSKTPVTLSLNGHWRDGRDLLYLDSATIDLPNVVNLVGSGRLRLHDASIDDLTAAVRSDDAGRLYDSLLQPFLIGTSADDLAMQGRLGLALHIDNKGIEQAGIELTELSMKDRKGRFELIGGSGSVAWDRSRDVPLSRLSVEKAAILGIPIDAFDIAARFAGDRVVLERPVVVPLLGGEIALDSFDLTGVLVAGQLPTWLASASLRNVSLKELTAALDWPSFEGVVSGELHDMQYRDQIFRIGGGLNLRAFDGALRVDDLEIKAPFGTVPILSANAGFEGLSLEALTKTFSFGRIDGRLDGDIRGIRLVAWEPDQFNLHFRTPENDRSRRRISQRAVENLTELGNGGVGGLSASFLRVFDEFRYSTIDMRVRLQGETAELGGLAREDGGYYLVKGSGLPRIDVIGRNRDVAWRDLVERLRRIQVESPQIQ